MADWNFDISIYQHSFNPYNFSDKDSYFRSGSSLPAQVLVAILFGLLVLGLSQRLPRQISHIIVDEAGQINGVLVVAEDYQLAPFESISSKYRAALSSPDAESSVDAEPSLDALIKASITPSDLAHVSPYHSQLKVFKHGYAKPAHGHPEKDFERAEGLALDAIQGESALMTVCDASPPQHLDPSCHFPRSVEFRSLYTGAARYNQQWPHTECENMVPWQ
ncbi:hypothetical protein F5884DRAFT_756575 [Xylogone sp. PMI_703]|nr:hypothetical protein F5884DRAFT_756575 [Xylogone sp. PMI_703]